MYIYSCHFVSWISIFRRSIVVVSVLQKKNGDDDDEEDLLWRSQYHHMHMSPFIIRLLPTVCLPRHEPFVFCVCFLHTLQDIAHKMWNEIKWNLPATGLSSVYIYLLAQQYNAGMGISMKDFARSIYYLGRGLVLLLYFFSLFSPFV